MLPLPAKPSARHWAYPGEGCATYRAVVSEAMGM
ncbi:Uncharacterised protein [Comamonas terrigena]|nr:Uncharacterised protein [Comamonas terrigena]